MDRGAWRAPVITKQLWNLELQFSESTCLPAKRVLPCTIRGRIRINLLKPLHVVGFLSIKENLSLNQLTSILLHSLKVVKILKWAEKSGTVSLYKWQTFKVLLKVLFVCFCPQRTSGKGQQRLNCQSNPRNKGGKVPWNWTTHEWLKREFSTGQWDAPFKTTNREDLGSMRSPRK